MFIHCFFFFSYCNSTFADKTYKYSFPQINVAYEVQENISQAIFVAEKHSAPMNGRQKETADEREKKKTTK